MYVTIISYLFGCIINTYMSLQFSDTTTKNGLLQDAEIVLFGDNGYTQITSNANRLLTFTQLMNRALDKVSTIIMASDGRWQFDDTNFSDLPIGTTTLVNAQQDYTLSVSHLRILRVEIMDQNGNYNKIEPIDWNDIQSRSMTEFMDTTGTPQYYDLVGSSIFLYPKPQTAYITAIAGMKIYFQREPSYFVSTDTTKVPGFNSLFHRLVSRIACHDYAMARQLPQKKDLEEQVTILQAELRDFYATRLPDEEIKFRTQGYNWS